MNVLIIGGTGSIGSRTTQELKKIGHNVIVAGSKSGDVQVDITNKNSIESMYKNIPKLDAVIVTTGKTYFGKLEDATEDDFYIGIKNKLMGQVNVVLVGLNHVNANASFTLTSGILNKEPIMNGVNSALVNGGLDGFVKGVALELLGKARVNIVSPTILENSVDRLGNSFKGYKPVSEYDVALAYIKCVEGNQTGQIYHIGY